MQGEARRGGNLQGTEHITRSLHVQVYCLACTRTGHVPTYLYELWDRSGPGSRYGANMVHGGLYEHGVAIATPAYAYTHVHLIPACVHVYGMYLLCKCCMELKLKIPRRRCLLLLLPCMPLRAPLTRASTLYSLSVYSMQMRAGKRAAHRKKSFSSLVSALICVPPLQSLEAQVVAAIDI